MMNRLTLIAFSAATLVAVSCKKKAEGDVFAQSDMPLTASQVVPVSQTPSSATGTVSASYDQHTHILNYTVNWTGLSTDSIRLIHVHGPAEPGYNGAVLQVNNPRSSSNASGFPLKASGSFSNTLFVDDVVVKESDLLANRYYIDIHTKTPSYLAAGEMRAQIVINP